MASTRKKAAKVKKKTKGQKKKKITKVILNKKKAVKKSKKIAVKSRTLKKTQKKGKKMSTETIKSGRSPLLDTSHLKVKFPFKEKYGNFIGGKFVEPKSGKYFDNVSPINNEIICSVPRSDAKDVEAALDAAHAAFPTW